MKYLFFKSNDCGLCEGMLQKTYNYIDKDKIQIIQLEKNPLLRGKYNVFSAPTLLFIDKEKEVHRESGFFNFQMIKKILSP
ncbi:MAG: thioredoxin family protein [Tissierellia bacterium]|nr:thioredoxin family protein [Tissierellia bacterium]